MSCKFRERSPIYLMLMMNNKQLGPAVLIIISQSRRDKLLCNFLMPVVWKDRGPYQRTHVLLYNHIYQQQAIHDFYH